LFEERKKSDSIKSDNNNNNNNNNDKEKRGVAISTLDTKTEAEIKVAEEDQQEKEIITNMETYYSFYYLRLVSIFFSVCSKQTAHVEINPPIDEFYI